MLLALPCLISVKNGEPLVFATARKTLIIRFGRIVVARLLNCGVIWDGPQEVYNSEIDDLHPLLVTVPEGVTVWSFFIMNFWMSRDFFTEDWKPHVA